MKKLVLILIALLCFGLVLTACEPSQTIPTEPQQTSTPSSDSQSNADPVADPSSAPDDPEPALPVYIPGSIILEDQKADDYSFERKYRHVYYTISGCFTEMLTEEEESRYYDWFFEVVDAAGGAEGLEEMMLVAYVKEFDISREEFDTAVDAFIAFTKQVGVSTSYEEFEVPNADIIYTFDNEIINEYYRYE